MRVEIIVTDGPAQGQHFTFDKPDRFLFGRSVDARVSLPNDPYVSRHHFLLEISPPDCKVSDLNSKNGVFVNGIRYGGRKPPGAGVKQAPDGKREIFLNDGDEIIVGDTCMKVSILWTESERRKAEGGTLSYNPRMAQQRRILCVRCRRDVTEEAGLRGQINGAEYVCQNCRQRESNTPKRMLDKLLKDAAAQKKRPEIPEIEGYRIEELINRGGMGMVYKAVDLEDHHTVAIKTMLPQVASDPDSVSAFLREIEVTRQLTHPNIVKLLDHGKSQGIFYFVLEFVKGMDLYRFLRSRGGQISLEEAAPIMLGTLDGLAYAHHANIIMEVVEGDAQTYTGIVHRDLKPQNILLAHKEHHWFPKITDFGISKSFESAGLTDITKPGDVLGTPMYWPREQITHYKYLNPATDVFSVAAVFYEMLTGSWVREGFTELFERCKRQRRHAAISDYMNIIIGNPAVPIRDRNPDIPEAIAAVIDRALREAEVPYDESQMHRVLAELRYPDGEAFRAALVHAFTHIGLSEGYLRELYQTHSSDEEYDAQEYAKMEASSQVSKKIAGKQFEQAGAQLSEEIFYSLMPPASSSEVALLVMDLRESSEYIHEFGDTQFFNFIGKIYQEVKNHPTAPELIFMKSTGDGFLAVFQTMTAAFGMAQHFLMSPIHPHIQIRLALHWGAVKTGPDGDVFGAEVHRVFRIEGVQQADQIETPEIQYVLPVSERILATEQALMQLEAEHRRRFLPAGAFWLKGFDEPCRLWVLLKH